MNLPYDLIVVCAAEGGSLVYCDLQVEWAHVSTHAADRFSDIHIERTRRP